MASVSDLELNHLYSGKVRDLYEVGDRHLLIVASDRMSAFDVVMEEPIPQKGRVLTAFTDYWLTTFTDAPSSLVSCDPKIIEETVPGFLGQTDWHGRTMLVRKAEMLLLECIVRGRLAGQAFDEYAARGTVHEMVVAPGMKLTDAFPEPMFTPSTKAASGHDVNISVDRAALLVGHDHVSRASELCIDLYTRAASAMAAAGLVLADTKFELGFVDGELVLCDEVVTPDSSRIWPADEVRSGETPPAFDKQPFRDWLVEQSWDKTPPPPTVPTDVLATTSARYVDAYQRVTGRSINDWYGASS
ncbi:MAG: phosphoribosylaminoimidazolesuccinocarboxamide synthase [Acidimicrobiales bacterium]